ncbi:hypothetical protein LSAT2_002905, partial [Lamellibrachia satsuma]
MRWSHLEVSRNGAVKWTDACDCRCYCSDDTRDDDIKGAPGLYGSINVSFTTRVLLPPATPGEFNDCQRRAIYQTGEITTGKSERRTAIVSANRPISSVSAARRRELTRGRSGVAY